MTEEFVVLVNDKDQQIGLMEKMEAHIQGILHRAFSIFLFNTKGEMLLQQRALSKYHSPGLWTNTCCSHPRDGESLEQATQRRLYEEMGMRCEMRKAFDFIYKADVGQGLTEHEFDHVFVGTTDLEPEINKEEVADWKYMLVSEVAASMEAHPEQYTVWFRIAFKQIEDYLKTNKIE
ncbi:MAG: isopentenyl-diphosphate Delta-isomerase [Bacteroidia bacterium]|jgi:isopentenyl-diphosphate delta-isomerase|nr:isopentenyl-diphosphate Delta-isomerase [Bacteroidia bacterium]